MKKIIETIRGVVGVSGVILWEKRTKEFHKLLPARLEKDKAERLCHCLTRFAELRDKNCRAIARFGKGWLFLYDYESFALMIIGKSDLNTTTLNLVSKSAISTLENALGKSTTTVASAIEFLPEHAQALARAVNLSLGFLQPQISRFEIAELLRHAKSDLIPEHPALKHFSVDANGGVIIIKGAEKHMDITAVHATARFIAALVELVKTRHNIPDFDIEKLTAPLHSLLTGLGFYRIFTESRKVQT
jgi:hypothetical protein